MARGLRTHGLTRNEIVLAKGPVVRKYDIRAGQPCRGRDRSGPWPVVGSSFTMSRGPSPVPRPSDACRRRQRKPRADRLDDDAIWTKLENSSISCLLDGEDYFAGSARVAAGEPLAQVARGLLRSGAVERHQRRRRDGDTNDARAPPILRHGHDFDQV